MHEYTMRIGIILIITLLLLSSLSLAQLPDIPDVGPSGCVEIGPDGDPVPCNKGTTKKTTKESVYDNPIYFTSEGSICYDGTTGKKKPWEDCKIRPLGGVPGNVEEDVDDEPEPEEEEEHEVLDPAAAAIKEYELWDNGTVTEAEMAPIIDEYFEVAGCEGAENDFNDPWSAAFISYVMKQAKVDFPVSCNHLNYFKKAKAGKGECETYPISENNLANLQAGDIVCKCREKKGEKTPCKYDYYNLPPGSPPGHCDLITKVSGNQISITGGNRWTRSTCGSDTSHGCTVATTTGGKSKFSGSKYFGIISCQKTNMADPVVKDPVAPIARSSYVKGEVWVTKKDGTRTKVNRYTEFHKGDIVESKGGTATVRFPDGSKIILGKSSKLTFVEDNKSSLSFGSIKAFFKKLSYTFNLETKGGVLVIRGTEFILTYNQETDVSNLHLYEGEVDVTANDEVKMVSEGTSVTFDETGVVDEQELSEDKWQLLIKELDLEEKVNYFFVMFFILFVAGIIGSSYFIVRKDKSGRKKSKLAISSFILGFFSLLLGWIPFLGWIFIILTLVFGFMALKRIKTQELSGRKLAIVGIFLGFVSLALALIIILVLV